MAKIEIAPELLAETLFPGAAVRVVGAGFDTVRGCAILEITGPNVPDAERVTAWVTRVVETKFEPRS